MFVDRFSIDVEFYVDREFVFVRSWQYNTKKMKTMFGVAYMIKIWTELALVAMQVQIERQLCRIFCSKLQKVEILKTDRRKTTSIDRRKKFLYVDSFQPIWSTLIIDAFTSKTNAMSQTPPLHTGDPPFVR